jgi:hypothetical protein
VIAPTSVAAWRELVASGGITRRRFEALEMLAIAGPMTGSELDRALNNPSAHKRLVELQDLGVVEITRERECSVTGRVCAEWCALDRMPTGEVKRTTKRAMRELEKENAQLKTRIAELERGRKWKPQLSLFSGGGR